MKYLYCFFCCLSFSLFSTDIIWIESLKNYHPYESKFSASGYSIWQEEALITEWKKGKEWSETHAFILEKMPKGTKIKGYDYPISFSGYSKLIKKGSGIGISATNLETVIDQVKGKLYEVILYENSSGVPKVIKTHVIWIANGTLKGIKDFPSVDAQLLIAQICLSIAWEEGFGERESSPLKLSPLDIERSLFKHIFGQKEAVTRISDLMKVYETGMHSTECPLGAFLFVGPTGVGKTALARSLAKEVYGSEDALFRIDMSHYSNEHDSSIGLIGDKRDAPFFNISKDGVLTNQLKSNPRIVVLLDEIEKAHPNTRKIFLQAFDEGKIHNGLDEEIDCRETIFIATSNFCSQEILHQHKMGFSSKEIVTNLNSTFTKEFSPEWMNRVEVIPFFPLGQESISLGVDKFLKELTSRVYMAQKIRLSFTQEVKNYLAITGYDANFGMRPLIRLIESKLAPKISQIILEEKPKRGTELILTLKKLNFKPGNQEQSYPIISGDLLKIKEKIAKTIFGQEYAIQRSADILKIFASGLKDPKSPIGAFLFIGPSGVGKTALAQAIAEEVYNNSDAMIRLDMSEYYDKSRITTLIGASPGYVGYEEEGALTGALKKRPRSVVLLDELEKADRSILKLFLQVFDEGRITDSKGETIDCTQAIFIATSNLHSKEIIELFKGGYEGKDVVNSLEPMLIRDFSPEFINRLEIIPFTPASHKLLNEVCRKFLGNIENRLKEAKGIELTFSKDICDYIISKGYNEQLGARPMKKLIEKEIVTLLAHKILEYNIKRNSKLQCILKGGTLDIILEAPLQSPISQ